MFHGGDSAIIQAESTLNALSASKAYGGIKNIKGGGQLNAVRERSVLMYLWVVAKIEEDIFRALS